MGAGEFWRVKALEALTRAEWEALCDGCGKCCTVRAYDGDETLVDTRVACRLFDARACRCSDYANRTAIVSDCVPLTPATVRALDWLPQTCAYRLLAEGRDLFWWHHLKSGSRETVHEAGMSVRARTISESDVEPDDLLRHAVVWPGEEGRGGD